MAQRKKGSLTDKQFERLVKKAHRADLVLRDAEANFASLKAELITEMRARGIAEHSSSEVRVALRTRPVRKVDLAELAKVLGRSLFTRLTVPALNTQKWHAAVESGLVTEKQANQIQVVTPSAPWIEFRLADD